MKAAMGGFALFASGPTLISQRSPEYLAILQFSMQRYRTLALLLIRGVVVEKLCDWYRSCAGWVGTAEFFFSFLGGEDQRWGWRAEEAHQSLDVLRSRCQEELLPNEFHAS